MNAARGTETRVPDVVPAGGGAERHLPKQWADDELNGERIAAPHPVRRDPRRRCGEAVPQEAVAAIPVGGR